MNPALTKNMKPESTQRECCMPRLIDYVCRQVQTHKHVLMYMNVVMCLCPHQRSPCFLFPDTVCVNHSTSTQVYIHRYISLSTWRRDQLRLCFGTHSQNTDIRTHVHICFEQVFPYVHWGGEKNKWKSYETRESPVASFASTKHRCQMYLRLFLLWQCYTLHSNILHCHSSFEAQAVCTAETEVHASPLPTHAPLSHCYCYRGFLLRIDRAVEWIAKHRLKTSTKTYSRHQR